MVNNINKNILEETIKLYTFVEFFAIKIGLYNAIFT